MKRGIAIGTACSAAILLIALLAFCALRRRKRIRKTVQTPRDIPKELPEATVMEGSEKCRVEEKLPPVELEAGPIYELDADADGFEGRIPSDHNAERGKDTARFSWCCEDDNAYMPKTSLGLGRDIAIAKQEPAADIVPTLLLSPPECPNIEVASPVTMPGPP
jgi:hypothetical protein